MDKRKLNMKKVYTTIAIIVIVFIWIFFSINRLPRYNKLTVLLDDNYIDVEDEIIIDQNENVYFSKDDIQKLFDKDLYYNEAQGEVITSGTRRVCVLEKDQNNILINNVEVQIEGSLKIEDEKVYIPIEEIDAVYDLDIKYESRSNRVIIESLLKDKKVATVKEKNKIKSGKGFFSKKIERLIIGDVVTILEESGNYKKIISPLGNIGYVKTKYLSNDQIIREQEKEYEMPKLEIYDRYSNISGVYENLTVDETKLNVVSPKFFYISDTGNVLDRTTNSTATYSIYKKWTEENKLLILPALDNNVQVSKSLLTYTQRAEVIYSLRDMLLKYGYMGINVDFENIDDMNTFYRFVIEMKPIFNEVGLKVIVTSNNSLDNNKLKDNSDYVVKK